MKSKVEILAKIKEIEDKNLFGELGYDLTINVSATVGQNFEQEVLNGFKSVKREVEEDKLPKAGQFVSELIPIVQAFRQQNNKAIKSSSAHTEIFAWFDLIEEGLTELLALFK